MGQIRNSKRVVEKNLQHLEELCKLLADPNTSVKQLNVLYAIRTAYAARGHLLDKELLIIRSNSIGQYQSRAAQRAAQRTAKQSSPLPQTHSKPVFDNEAKQLNALGAKDAVSEEVRKTRVDRVKEIKIKEEK